MNKLFLTAFILVFATATFAYAHGGRTNSEGCHNQTSNNTYHCHNSGKSSSSSTSYKDILGDVPTSNPYKYDRDEYDFDRDSLNYSLSENGYWSDKPLSECKSVHIDHIVSLSDIHESGGYKMSSAEKRKVANDPDYLVATCGRWNQSKGNLSPMKWIKRSSDNNGPKVDWTPKRKCEYINRYMLFKLKYNLELSDFEMITYSTIYCANN